MDKETRKKEKVKIRAVTLESGRTDLSGQPAWIDGTDLDNGNLSAGN